MLFTIKFNGRFWDVLDDQGGWVNEYDTVEEAIEMLLDPQLQVEGIETEYVIVP